MENSGNLDIWKKDISKEERDKLKKLSLAKINSFMEQKKILLERLIETEDLRERKNILIEMLEIDREIIIQEKIIKEKSESN